MKVYCVYFIKPDGCLDLKAIFHSQDKAVRFAVNYEGEQNDPIEYYVEPRWVD